MSRRKSTEDGCSGPRAERGAVGGRGTGGELGLGGGRGMRRRRRGGGEGGLGEAGEVGVDAGAACAQLGRLVRRRALLARRAVLRAAGACHLGGGGDDAAGWAGVRVCWQVLLRAGGAAGGQAGAVVRACSGQARVCFLERRLTCRARGGRVAAGAVLPLLAFCSLKLVLVFVFSAGVVVLPFWGASSCGQRGTREASRGVSLGGEGGCDGRSGEGLGLQLYSYTCHTYVH